MESVCYHELFPFNDHGAGGGRSHSATIPLDVRGRLALGSQSFG